MIDRSPLRLKRSSESLMLGVDDKRRPGGSRHGEGQALAPEFRQRGVPRERTWECARTRAERARRATGREPAVPAMWLFNDLEPARADRQPSALSSLLSDAARLGCVPAARDHS